ncbi:MAG: hypothetical protein EXR77_16065 [Myxococcales bacterium]|nr:hypothetical protein [Myxococcales bacterium]
MNICSVRAPVRVLLLAVLGGAGCGDAATAAVSDALTASADIVSDSGAGIGATSDATAADGDAAVQVGADGDAGAASAAVDPAPLADTSEAQDMDSGTVVAADSATELGADTATSKCNPASPCPTPASVCQYAACEPAVGCLAIALPDGTVCDDSNPCTAGSTCGQGVCSGGPPISCDDKTHVLKTVARWAPACSCRWMAPFATTTARAPSKPRANLVNAAVAFPCVSVKRVRTARRKTMAICATVRCFATKRRMSAASTRRP